MTVMKDSRSVCTFVRKINSVCFGGDIRTRQLERSIRGLEGQGYKYPEAVAIFSC